MNDNFIIISINGIDYYIEADRLQDLNYIENKLVNTSNSSLTLVSAFSDQYTYPRISCNSMQQCKLYQSNNSNYSLVYSNYSYTKDFNILSLGTNNIQSLIFYMVFMILCLRLLFKR